MRDNHEDKKRKSGGKPTAQGMIYAAKTHGFSAADLDELSVGALIDIVSESIPDKDRVYIATQADIDRWTGF